MGLDDITALIAFAGMVACPVIAVFWIKKALNKQPAGALKPAFFVTLALTAVFLVVFNFVYEEEPEASDDIAGERAGVVETSTQDATSQRGDDVEAGRSDALIGENDADAANEADAYRSVDEILGPIFAQQRDYSSE